jgi:hypothetical protein
MAISNVLYLAVLPLIRIPPRFAFGVGFNRLGTPGGYAANIPDHEQVEQFMTLFPHRDFATEFFPNEVDRYVSDFRAAADQYLRGGHVSGYLVEKIPTENGRVVVKVTQDVSE